jgi:hypothetical protein
MLLILINRKMLGPAVTSTGVAITIYMITATLIYALELDYQWIASSLFSICFVI